MQTQEHDKYNIIKSSSWQNNVIAETAMSELESNFAIYDCEANLLFVCTADQHLEHF